MGMIRPTVLVLLEGDIAGQAVALAIYNLFSLHVKTPILGAFITRKIVIDYSIPPDCNL
jgi:hypothetical protein